MTADGGYAVAGYTQSSDGDVSFNHGGQDMWVVKISSAGSIQWQKTLGGSNNEYANSITILSDGGYAVAGYTRSGNGDIAGSLNGLEDFFISKMDAAGNVIRLYEDLP